VVYSFKASGDFAPTFVSENIIDVFGYPPAEYLQDPSFWREWVHPDDLARVEEAVASFFKNGVHAVEYRFRRKDGSYCWVNDEQHLIRGDDGKPLEIVGMWTDVTARKAAEEARAAAHARNRPAARQLARGDLQLQGERRLRADLRQREHQGLARLRAAGIPGGRRFLAPLRAPGRLRRGGSGVGSAVQEGRHTVEYRFLKKDGTYCWVNDAQQLIRDPQGQPVEVVGSWSDVSERKRAEEAAAAARERIEHLLASSPAVIYSFRATGDYAPTFISRNVRDLLGYEPEEYLDSPDFWRGRVHPADSDRILADFPRLFAEGHLSIEYRFRKKDGSYCWISDELQLQRNAAGDPVEVVGSWNDISARKQIGEALVAAQDRIGLGYDREEYLHSPDFWQSRLHPADSPRILRAYSRLFEEERLSNEYRFRKKDGSYCWVSDELQVLRNLSGDPVEVVGAWSDITARKQLGEALVAAQERLVHLLSCAPAVIYSYRATGDFAPTFVSQNITDWLGYDPQEYLENPDFWRVRVHPDELARVEAESVQLFKKGRHTVEYRFLKKDGTYCWVIDEQHLIRNRDGEPVEWSARGATSPRQRRRRSPSAAASSA
jgi:PAS domain S-box-containing protein